jgi:hypothetical protein
MRYEAYYNLHQQCLSARPTGRHGYVKHYQFLCLSNVKFAVQPAGRQKVLNEKKKNVHAFVRGDMVTWSPHRKEGEYYPDIDNEVSVDRFREDERYEEVTYNPYKYESFVRKDNGQPIFEAEHAWVIGKHIFVPADV